MSMLHIAKDWTGRRYINVGRGWLCVGWARGRVERVWWRGNLVYAIRRRDVKWGA